MRKLTKANDLLQVLQAPTEMFRRTATPLAAELPVDPQTAPYLVSTTRSLMWHPKDFGGKVRAAMRQEPLGSLYSEVIREVCETSVQAEWGSVFPYTLQGLDQAIAYVEGYGLGDVEILAPAPEIDGLLREMSIYASKHIVRVDYLPHRTVVVVPKDRDYLGTAMRPGDHDRWLVLLHNPSRGMAVAGWNS